MLDSKGVLEFNITNTNLIKTRRKANIGIGILIGSITGFSAGWLIGFSKGDDSGGFFRFTAEEKGIFGGILSWCLYFQQTHS